MKEYFDATKKQIDEVAGKPAHGDMAEIAKMGTLGLIGTNIMLSEYLGKLTGEEARQLHEYRIQIIESI